MMHVFSVFIRRIFLRLGFSVCISRITDDLKFRTLIAKFKPRLIDKTLIRLDRDTTTGPSLVLPNCWIGK